MNNSQMYNAIGMWLITLGKLINSLNKPDCEREIEIEAGIETLSVQFNEIIHQIKIQDKNEY